VEVAGSGDNQEYGGHCECVLPGRWSGGSEFEEGGGLVLGCVGDVVERRSRDH
jgi:hypothetical protein